MTNFRSASENKIKVLIVDDSALIRQLLTEILSSAPDIEVVGAAPDPLIARNKIKQLNPDVLTLDVEMPKMDGLTFLSHLMRLRPMPVVMISTLTEANAETTLRALELGAVDYFPKPQVGASHELRQYAADIIERVRMASRVRYLQGPNGAVAVPVSSPRSNPGAVVDASERRPVSAGLGGPRSAPRAVPLSQSRASRGGRPDIGAGEVSPKLSADAVLPRREGRPPRQLTERVVAIGASTGGTEAVRVVLSQLTAEMPIIVITQHIPEAFSRSFAARLNQTCPMHVSEAEDGEVLTAGHAYVAPGNHHLLVFREGPYYVARLHDGPLVNRHRPSVDVLFRSVAQSVGPNAIGVILTGMGDDGARGLQEMLEAGAQTIAQDKHTSVVWGMPGEAVKLNAAERVLPLHDIPRHLLMLTRPGASPAHHTMAAGPRSNV